MPGFSLYGGGGFGNVLEEPIVPAISGASVIKFAVGAALFLYIFRKIGR